MTLDLLDSLTRHGPLSGVQLILLAEPPEQLPEHRTLQALQRRGRRVTSGERGEFLDRDTGVSWHFRPDLGPPTDQLAHDALARASRGE